MLNRGLLKHFYGINYWDIPAGYLCPPIPGRADYIHYLADLLAQGNDDNIPVGGNIRVLDIGVGANCVYPIIGNSVYGWQFVGADIDPIAIKSANKIVSLNSKVKSNIECRLQPNAGDIFKGIVKPGEVFDLTICNPPFHASARDALAETDKKWKKLGIVGQKKSTLNFGGQKNELWCPGGEAAFINRIIEQSALIAEQCFWFSTLVSKKNTLAGVYKALEKARVLNVKTINMKQGQKASRMVAWTFLNESRQQDWKNQRWMTQPK